MKDTLKKLYFKRVLKFIFSIGAFCTIGFLFLFFLKPTHEKNLLYPMQNVVTNIAYRGITQNGREFTVLSEKGKQVAPHIFTFNQINSSFQVQDKKITVQAKQGLFDNKKNILSLTDNIHFQHDNGLKIHTTAAQVNIKDGSMSGDTKVQGQHKNAIFTGESFQVSPSGQEIILSGNPHILFNLP